MGGGAGANAVRAEEAEVVVAEHAARLALAQHRDRLVAEPVLLDHVAGAQQLVDVTHERERGRETGRVAMDVGNDADPHVAYCPLGLRRSPDCDRLASSTVPSGGPD